MEEGCKLGNLQIRSTEKVKIKPPMTGPFRGNLPMTTVRFYRDRGKLDVHVSATAFAPVSPKYIKKKAESRKTTKKDRVKKI